jgi:hypothetical protein
MAGYVKWKREEMAGYVKRVPLFSWLTNLLGTPGIV